MQAVTWKTVSSAVLALAAATQTFQATAATDSNKDPSRHSLSEASDFSTPFVAIQKRKSMPGNSPPGYGRDAPRAEMRDAGSNLFRSADADRDGTLSESELLNLHTLMYVQMDLSGDGAIQFEEFEVYFASPKPMAPMAPMAEVDEESLAAPVWDDEPIDFDPYAEPFADIIDEMFSEEPMNFETEPIDPFVDRFDTNFNGTVERAEVPRAMRTQLFDWLDGDQDDVLCMAEMSRMKGTTESGQAPLVSAPTDEEPMRHVEIETAADDLYAAAPQPRRSRLPPADEEIAGMEAKMDAEVLALSDILDANGDGLIVKGEVPESIAPYFTLLDRDSSGIVDREEIRFALSEDIPSANSEMDRLEGQFARLVDRLDSNGDGRVLIGEFPVSFHADFLLFDFNDDGVLDAKDVRAIRSFLDHPADTGRSMMER